MGATSGKIAKLVMLLTLVALAAGAATLAIQYRALKLVHADVDASHTAQAQAAQSFTALTRLREQLCKEINSLLATGAYPTGAVSPSLRDVEQLVIQYRADVAAIGDRGSGPASADSQYQEQARALFELRDSVATLMRQISKNSRALTEARGHLLEHLDDAHTIAHTIYGRRRLKMVATLRQAERAGDRDAADVATRFLGALESVGSVRMLAIELADLAMLIERLTAATSADQLITLKDNQIRQTIARVREAAERLEASPEFAIGKSIDGIQDALFGEGAADDQAHQTMLVGLDGAYARKLTQIQLADDFQRIRARASAAIESSVALERELEGALATSIAAAAVRLEQGFVSAWHGSLLAGSIVMLAFILLAMRVIKLGNAAESELHERNLALQAAVKSREEATVAAEAANRSKSEFLANMSHEIRTPMTAVLGFADAALDGCPQNCEFGAAAHREHLEAISRNGAHLLQLINDILDLSKIEAGKLEIERTACSPCHIIAEVDSLISVRSRSKGLEVRFEFESSIPATIVSDPTRVRQVLVNLLGNAIKFTEKGSVSLISRLEQQPSGEHELRFDIVDTGVGMTAEQAGKLFRAFSQADASTTRKFGGTGLGLTISRRLAVALGGDVQLIETAPGCGSRFRFSVAVGSLDGVPMIARPHDLIRMEPEGPQRDAKAIERLESRILLAEDGPDNQRLIVHVLQKIGAEVTVVENGALAFECALAEQRAGRPFDVVLMDMQMPVMDGYTATTKLRENGYRDPIIALTAHAMATDRQQCIEAGCDEHLTKPIDRKKFIATIRRFSNAVREARDARVRESAGATVDTVAN